MSTSNAANPATPNICSTIATQLTHFHALTEEERLFRDAIHNVEARKKKKKELPEFFDKLRIAQNLEDVRLALNAEKNGNKIWSVGVGRSWLDQLGKFAEYILYYKVFLDAFVQRSPALGSPIWGTFAFLLAVLQDTMTAKQDLEHIEYRLQQSYERFKTYFCIGRELSGNLKQALTKYYETVLEFAVDLHGEFCKTRMIAAWGLLHRTVKSRLDDLSKVIRDIIYDVDQGALHDRLKSTDVKIEKLGGTLQVAVANNTSSWSPQQSHTSRGLVHGLPQVNACFTGRSKYLYNIYKNLHSRTDRQNCVALYGMGGIGKTQILRKYANDNVKSSKNQQGYDAVLYVNAHSSASISAAVASFLRDPIPSGPSLKSDDEKLAALHSWLLARENWLLVLDNIRDYADVRPLLPNGNVGHILCSTRHKLVASQIAGPSNSHEVLGLSEDESMRLVQSLVATGGHDVGMDQQSVNEVVDFAGGIPLLIEQIVHNTIFGKSTLTKTLQSIRENTELLRHQNISSLHEDNLSLGGVIMQAFDTLKTCSDRAEVLFMVLMYMETARIPVSLLREGIDQFQQYIDRRFTYDRGQIDNVAGKYHDRHDGGDQCLPKFRLWEETDPFKPKTWVQARKTRAALKREAQEHLPLDDTESWSLLQQAFDPGTPLRRLFENKVMLDEAIITLCDMGAVRQLDSAHLWMHDLVAEVARALIAVQPPVYSERIITLVSAVTVYLAIPVPGQHYSQSKKAACEQYLPHAIACHNHLKALKTLNDSSVGPELSHIIASTIYEHGYVMQHDSPFRSLEERSRERRKWAIEYYREAHTGYLAGWKRLQHVHGIKERCISLATLADKTRETSWTHSSRHYSLVRYVSECERYGRNAPWRAMQTALRLSHLLERDPDTVAQAAGYAKNVLDFYKSAFGLNDDETMGVKSILFEQLGPLSRKWHDAYSFSVQCLQELTGWDGDLAALSSRKVDNALRTSIVQHARGFSWVRNAGTCCVEMAKELYAMQLDTDARASAQKAVVFRKMGLEHVQWLYGKDDPFVHMDTMLLAEAHELAKETAEAMKCYSCAIICNLNSADISIGDTAWWDDDFINKKIEIFDQAKLRLMELCGNDGDVVKYINETQTRIERWQRERAERNINFGDYVSEADEDSQPADREATLRHPSQA